MSVVNIQNNFFNELRKSKNTITMFLTNGVKVDGVIESFDQYTVVINVRGKQQLVFKHAISTVISPTKINYQKDEVESAD